MKKIIIFIVIIVSLWYLNQAQPSIYQVKPRDNISSIAEDLKQNRIIKSTIFFRLLAKIHGENPKIGYYQLNNIWQFLSDINSAKVKSSYLTLVPGKTAQDYYEQLKNHQYINTTNSLSEIIRKLNIKTPYEGRFYPDTYKFNYGDSALSILQRSYELMNNNINNIWLGRDKNKHIKNQYDLIILASIIEKESSNNKEKSDIAGVMINRLDKNMRLQTDPTVVYALKQKYGNNYQAKLSKKDLSINSPYNTYKIKGLPAGAIASPSKNSLLAASKPNKHNFYYFVAKNKNEHIFATTYREHRENIAKYLK